MIGGRYTLDREVGRGGMGSVWLGRDEVLGRPVALKRVGVAPGGTSPDLLRAEREARIAASLNHPNIVGVFDLVDDGDHSYLVMEYVEGRTLADLVRDGGALTTREAARILAQVAAALTAAHEQHVVHRDVKPSNILVRDDGHAKLSDFGIARSEADPSLTQTGLVTGSPAYLSPEVASGKLATTASDVWSLGATLFHAIAGRPPYDVGDNVLGALYQIVNEPPPRLDNAGELTPVLLATMNHDPRRRWSMGDVARVLELVAAAPDEPDGSAGAAAAPVPPVEADPPTRPLTAAPPVPPPRAATPPTPAPEPTPAPARASAPPAARERQGRGAVLPVLVGALVVVLLAVIGFLVLQDDPQEPTVAPGNPTSTTTEPSSEPSEPSSSPTTSEGPTAADIEGFAENYVTTAAADPRAGFDLLTPDFQRASGGFAGYRDGFWGSVTDVRVQSVTADPEALTVTYTYSYDLENGDSRTETVSLQLADEDGRLLIAGDA
ncbi:serine/threonine-protein kinase [Nocardioides litoris]|uniref:serine/threonine-protein kinase n=1 Tax=Nocardioides litoris TaxID=1926648 RepID=UPI00112145AA|nr:serine/threonine-protein kinase [Nocardioides litoris]